MSAIGVQTGLLTVLLAAAFSCAPPLSASKNLDRQAQALMRLGAMVSIRYETGAASGLEVTLPQEPEAVRKAIWALLSSSEAVVIGLDVAGNTLSDLEAQAVRRLSNLRCIVFERKQSEKVYLSLKGLHRLKTVVIRHAAIGPAVATVIAGAKEVERLDLTGARIAPAELRTILRNPRLRELYFLCDHLGDDMVRAIGEARRLKVLALLGIAKGAKGLGNLTALEVLAVGGLESAADFEEIGTMNGLRTLYLRGRLGEAGLAAVHLPRGLEAVALSCRQLSPRILGELMSCENLKQVSLSLQRFSKSDLGALAAMPRLERLMLSTEEPLDVKPADFKRFPKLKELGVAWWGTEYARYVSELKETLPATRISEDIPDTVTSWYEDPRTFCRSRGDVPK